jgi:glycosyltransferase involved in cell wall biosynthesis
MKVAMITGSCPPDACGVGDYTFRLVQALSESGADIEIITKQSWKLTNIRKLAREVSTVSPDLIHIQYPTVGYGSKLGPQMLSLLVPRCVITLHEVSQANPLRRLSLYPYSLRADRIVFTNSFEKEYATKYAPWIARRSSVIPIGSAIRSCNSNLVKDLDEIVHFGLIRPQKGIEEVLSLARLIKINSLSLKIRMIGIVEPRFQQYLQKLQNISTDLPVIWNLGLPEEEVSVLLSRSKVAYMPFPDGVSERRSSLLALLSNNVVTVTTFGSFAPSEMNGVVKYAATPVDALTTIKDCLSNTEKNSEVINKMKKYIQRRQWSEIASMHVMLYRSLLGN